MASEHTPVLNFLLVDSWFEICSEAELSRKRKVFERNQLDVILPLNYSHCGFCDKISYELILKWEWSPPEFRTLWCRIVYVHKNQSPPESSHWLTATSILTAWLQISSRRHNSKSRDLNTGGYIMYMYCWEFEMSWDIICEINTMHARRNDRRRRVSCRETCKI